MPNSEKAGLHPIVHRQLNRFFGGVDELPQEMRAFVEALDLSFKHIDENRAMYERAMELSSSELSEINLKLREDAKRKSEEFAKLKEAMCDLGLETPDNQEDILSVLDVLKTEMHKRWKAEEKTRLSEEKFRNIIEHMQLGLVEINLEGNIQFVYDWFLVMSGYSKEELIGKSAREVLLDPVSWSELDKQLQARRNGEYGVYEALMVKKNGEKLWVIISGAPLFDVDKNIIGSVGVFFDISKQKLTEHALEIARESAEEALKGRELFFANVSHEIRTPMNAVLGMSRLLMDTPLDSVQKEYLKAIRNSAQGLMSIVNDVLDLSKIKAGKFSFESIPFNLQVLAEEVRSAMQVRAVEKNLEFKLNINSDCCRDYLSDPYRLKQVLINLVGNAIKFTENGFVQINVSQVNSRPNSDTLKFSIVDSGMGIPDSKINLLFQDFVQVNDSDTRKFGGTGLGLSISRQLVEMFGGKIHVESKVGEGSVFSFEIELEYGSSEDLDNRDTIDIDLLKSKVVLLVEDNPINRLLATTILKQWHLEVIEANNGIEALDIIGKVHLDIILMDLQMPEMDGVEATKILRDRGIDLPVIALTANALKGERENCLAAGMDDYLSKPFEPRELFAAMAKLMNAEKDALFLKHGAIVKNAEQEPEMINETVHLLYKKMKPAMHDIKLAYESGAHESLKQLADKWSKRAYMLRAWRLAFLLNQLTKDQNLQDSNAVVLIIQQIDIESGKLLLILQNALSISVRA
jgi:PAS domain S-box-containing protein